MAKIVTLKDDSVSPAVVAYPQTKAEAVFMDSGDPVEKTVTELGKHADELVNTYTETSRASYSQSGYNSGYKALTLKANTTYRLSLQVIGFDTHPNNLSVLLCPSQSTSNNLDITSLFGGSAAVTSGRELYIDFTPQTTYYYMRTAFSNSSYSPETENSVLMIAEVKSNKFSAIDARLGADEVIIDGINEELHFREIGTTEYSQAGYATYGYLGFVIDRGVACRIKLTTSNFPSGYSISNIFVCDSASGQGRIEDIKSLFDSTAVNQTIQANYTNNTGKTISYIEIVMNVSSFPGGDTVKVNVNISEIISQDIARKPLSGKTVVMLGDSITQLPRTGTNTIGLGIVEYFAEITGATVIRGAIGGSHLRSRRIVTNVSDIVDVNYAKATMDISMIVQQLIAQDFTLAKAGQQWLKNNNLADVYVDTILSDLESVDLANVDVLTILGGTNDYANNVELDSVDSTDRMLENGAWNYMLEALATNYPNLSVVVFTPIVKKPDGVWCEDVTNTIDLYLHDYAKCNQDAAKRFQYPSCDLFYELGVNKYNFYTYITQDNTHPTNYGFRAIAIKMASFITANLNRFNP